MTCSLLTRKKRNRFPYRTLSRQSILFYCKMKNNVLALYGVDAPSFGPK